MTEVLGFFVRHWLFSLVCLALLATQGVKHLSEVSEQRARSTSDIYNYGQYTRQNAALNTKPIAAGTIIPQDFSLYEVTEKKVHALRLADLLKEGPLVIETGSITCPIFRSKEVSMDDLAKKYAGKATVVLLYTREAHPGSLNWLPFKAQHRSIEDKVQRARYLKTEFGVERRVIVDSLDGQLHRILGSAPNSIHVMTSEGFVVHSALWNKSSEAVSSLEQLLRVGGKAKRLSQLHYNDCMDPGMSPKDLPKTLFSMVRHAGVDAIYDMAKMFHQNRKQAGKRPKNCVENTQIINRWAQMNH